MLSEWCRCSVCGKEPWYERLWGTVVCAILVDAVLLGIIFLALR